MSAEPMLSDWAIAKWKRRTYRGTDAHRRQRLKARHAGYRKRELDFRSTGQQALADTYLVKQLEIEAKL